MADVFQNMLYGHVSSKIIQASISIQWHITVDCDQSCKHCYMFESDTYLSEKNNPLTFEECCQLIDQYEELLERFNLNGSFFITGGDPILHPDFWDILDYITQKPSVSASLMGNPYHITDEVAERFRKLGIMGYQISLDGLEETHDKFRKKGSFKESLRALQVLNRHGINTNVMFTLSKQNAAELIHLYTFLNQLDYINSFSFDRLVPEGAGSVLAEEGRMNAIEHRNLLYKMFLSEINQTGNVYQIRKDELWRVLFHELGLLRPFEEDPGALCQGCGTLFKVFSVLADGTIYSCRRLPITIGKFPEENIWDVFLNSPLLQKMRQLENYEKCRDCELGPYCRGCPAVRYGFMGDPLKPDPHCWKQVEKK